MKFKSDNILGYGLYILSLFFFAFLFFNLTNLLWADESYTLYHIVLLPYTQMMSNIISDVHPYLYYFILYFVLHLLEILKVSFDPIILARIVSLIPIGFVLIFNITTIRKEFSPLFAGIFSFSIISLPNFMYLGTTIRMYTYGFLFSTLGFFYAYKIVSKGKTRHYIFLTLLSIMGIYTHYFSLYIVFCIYTVLFVYLFFNNKQEIKKLILSLSVVVLSFLIWIPVFIYQIRNGWASWIPQPDLDDLLNTIYYVFSPNNEFSIIGVIFIFSILFLFLYQIIGKQGRFLMDVKGKNFLVLGVLVFIMVLILSVISSNIAVSSFLPRYMFLALGIFYLSFTYILTKTYPKKIIFVPILIILILTSFASTSVFLEDKKVI